MAELYSSLTYKEAMDHWCFNNANRLLDELIEYANQHSDIIRQFLPEAANEFTKYQRMESMIFRIKDNTAATDGI